MISVQPMERGRMEGWPNVVVMPFDPALGFFAIAVETFGAGRCQPRFQPQQQQKRRAAD